MSEKRSFEIFMNYLGGVQKFDYFITGLAGTLFAYIGQTYTPKVIGWNIASLEPLALICLAAAVLFGLLRIQNHIEMHGEQHRLLEFTEKNGVQSATDASLVNSLNQDLKQSSIRSLNLYKIRNNFLLAGFAAVLLSKILQPYQQSATTPFDLLDKKEIRESITKAGLKQYTRDGTSFRIDQIRPSDDGTAFVVFVSYNIGESPSEQSTATAFTDSLIFKRNEFGRWKCQDWNVVTFEEPIKK